jgi:hypothetical protein
MDMKELKEYFGSAYKFEKATGLSHASWTDWRNKGYIPLSAQAKIENFTAGKLKAVLEHTEEGNYQPFDRVKALMNRTKRAYIEKSIKDAVVKLRNLIGSTECVIEVEEIFNECLSALKKGVGNE